MNEISRKQDERAEQRRLDRVTRQTIIIQFVDAAVRVADWANELTEAEIDGVLRQIHELIDGFAARRVSAPTPGWKLRPTAEASPVTGAAPEPEERPESPTPPPEAFPGFSLGTFQAQPRTKARYCECGLSLCPIHGVTSSE